jgi:GNAT superfamily N-acetyltransferase
VSRLRIREGTAADADAVARLHWRGWETTYRGLVPERLLAARPLARRQAEWRERLGADPRILRLAEDESGLPLGFIRAEPQRTDPLRLPPDGGFDLEISYLYVAPEAQGRGVGRALLADVGRVALAAGQRRILVVAFKGNPFARFYPRMGARLIREEPFILDGWAGFDLYFGWDDVSRLLAAAERP